MQIVRLLALELQLVVFYAGDKCYFNSSIICFKTFHCRHGLKNPNGFQVPSSTAQAYESEIWMEQLNSNSFTKTAHMRPAKLGSRKVINY